MIALAIAAPTQGEVRAQFDRISAALTRDGYAVLSVEFSRDPQRAGMLATAQIIESVEGEMT